MNDYPYDSANTTTPVDCININKDETIQIDGQLLTAEYIWSKQGQDRIDLVMKVFNYYREKGFPVPKLTEDEISEGFEKLKRCEVEIVNNTIKNSATAGLDVAKHFTGEHYLAAKGSPKSHSCLEIFNDDEMFIKVLKNRMGWLLSSEELPNQPYLFNITDKMLFQGMRSSGLAANVSNFKPAVAKSLYKKYNVKKTFDPSSGWGARALAACSLGVEYYGTDPLTGKCVNDLLQHFNNSGKVFMNGSEDTEVYNNIPKVDFIFTSPPYFDLEQYGDDENQSINKFDTYEVWLNDFWGKTVENCLTILEENGKFSFAMVDIVGKKNIALDMTVMCEKLGLLLVERIDMVTSASHLSGKAKSGKDQKNSDRVYVFKKVK